MVATVFGGLVTWQKEALLQSLGDTTQPHGAREHEERTSDWTGTVPNRTPGPVLCGTCTQVYYRSHQATSLRPKQQFLRTSVCSVHEGQSQDSPEGMAFPKDTVLANHKSNRNDRQIPRVQIPTAGVCWLRVPGPFKYPWEGSILNSLDPWSYWCWIFWPLWLSTHQSGPVSLKLGAFLSNT